ncbi:hypothetical protein BCR44DRAFT_1143252 [Catenaria anguillulae PL171]|uniref:Uncharacterized protein n=1 Tax=Catenaria anguillulae PL171 TaxID=765915 RepID=A0A1Y2HM42_9FUNG|nr:hypothetical protein BCR44DRAFT_1143252 [Catenaria anguillulae PL171]
MSSLPSSLSFQCVRIRFNLPRLPRRISLAPFCFNDFHPVFVKNTISKVTRLDKDFDKNNPGYWNPFDNIIFNGIILLLGPVAIVLLAICYQWIRTKWNVVKTAIVYVFMIGAIGLEGFRIAYLVNDILYHTDVWDQGTYIIAYIFCSAEVLFALIFFSVSKISSSASERPAE